MFARLKSWLGRERALRKARAARKAAFHAHREAVARRDTRTKHITRAKLTQATSDLLRLEVGR